MPLVDSGSSLFAGSAEEFIRMAPESSLTAHLTREFNRRWGTATDSEIRSWKNSLAALAKVVGKSGLDQSGVGVELKLPLTNKRVDASFVARDLSGNPHVLLCELKQWETAAPSLYPDNVRVGNKELLHPSVQASAYAEYLRNSHSAFTEEGFRLSACAYLHNMRGDDTGGLKGLEFTAAVSEVPIYSKDDQATFADHLGQSLGGGGGLDLLHHVIYGRYSPSKSLIDGIAKALRDSPVWTLLDEQRVAFNVVQGLVERAVGNGEKAVVIIRGGPGTGKSVIAAHLVISQAKRGRIACHATGSKAFTTNLRAIYPNRGAASFFRYFNNFRHKDTEPDSLDVIVCDEAHRLRETSNDRFTKKALKSEISQASEIIRASRVSVFLLDERQNVRPEEIGSIAAIKHAATQEGVPFQEYALDAQFRCNGCQGYIEWVDDLMSHKPKAPGGWVGGDYDIRMFNSPESLEAEILAKAAQGATARLVAGFCWTWSDPLPGGQLEPDVEIGPWRRPWNEKAPEQRSPAGSAPPPQRHPYYLWATQPERVGEVGCIYSAQGFEFDYCGVILGNDLVWRQTGWVGNRDASHDPSIKRRRMDQPDLVALLQHTYRVLLTRGMKGTFIYSTDPETRMFLSDLLSRRS